MIVDKSPEDTPPADAPPAYDGPARARVSLPDLGLRREYPIDGKHAYEYTPPPTASSSSYQFQERRPPSAGVRLPSSPWSLFSPGPSAHVLAKTAQEVRVSVLGLIYHLIMRTPPDPSVLAGPSAASASVGPDPDHDSDLAYADALLDNCRTTCEKHGLQFSDILQERSIEGYTPLYWAIIRRARRYSAGASSMHNAGDAAPSVSHSDLISLLTTLSAPLRPSTRSDIRLACLTNGDDALFQRFRHTPLAGFAFITAKDALVLGLPPPASDGSSSPIQDNKGRNRTSRSVKGKEVVMQADRVDVRDVGTDDSGFAVQLEMRMFQKRMRVSGEVGVEFIAGGRIWTLTFFTVPPPTPPSSSSSSFHTTENTRTLVPAHAYSGLKPGTWAVALALGEHSPPTWVDARIVVDPHDAQQHNQTQTPPTELLIDAPIAGSSSSSDAPQKQKPKQTIALRLKSGSSKLTAAPTQLRRQNRTFDEEERRRQRLVVVAVDDSLAGVNLQFDGSSYIAQDGTLRARLEARLVKANQLADGECVIG